MPRRSRKLTDNGYYHILSRRNDRKNIFRCEEDYLKFLTITIRYLAKYDAVGFAFQNRYKSLFIERESYLMECGRYIERNPLRAKLTNDLHRYPWNSFSFYADGLHDVIIKYPNPGFLGLAGSQEERQRRFRDYVLQSRSYEQLVDETFRLE
jgi:hypothetical protein